MHARQIILGMAAAIAFLAPPVWTSPVRAQAPQPGSELAPPWASKSQNAIKQNGTDKASEETAPPLHPTGKTGPMNTLGAERRGAEWPNKDATRPAGPITRRDILGVGGALNKPAKKTLRALPKALQPKLNDRADARAWARYIRNNFNDFGFLGNVPYGGNAVFDPDGQYFPNGYTPRGLEARIAAENAAMGLIPGFPAGPPYQMPTEFFKYHNKELKKVIAHLQSQQYVPYDFVYEVYRGLQKARHAGQRLLNPSDGDKWVSSQQYNELIGQKFIEYQGPALGSEDEERLTDEQYASLSPEEQERVRQQEASKTLKREHEAKLAEEGSDVDRALYELSQYDKELGEKYSSWLDGLVDPNKVVWNGETRRRERYGYEPNIRTYESVLVEMRKEVSKNRKLIEQKYNDYFHETDKFDKARKRAEYLEQTKLHPLLRNLATAVDQQYQDLMELQADEKSKVSSWRLQRLKRAVGLGGEDEKTQPEND